jgi:hypothetical protein
MRQQLAIIVDGVWQHPQEVQVSDDQRAVVSSSGVDRIVALLSEVVSLAQDLSEADQRRVRDFTQAAQSMLTATTYLNKSDQTIFENALRNSVRK